MVIGKARENVCRVSARGSECELHLYAMVQAKAVKPAKKADPVPMTRGGSAGQKSVVGSCVIRDDAYMC